MKDTLKSRSLLRDCSPFCQLLNLVVFRPCPSLSPLSLPRQRKMGPTRRRPGPYKTGHGGPCPSFADALSYKWERRFSFEPLLLTIVTTIAIAPEIQDRKEIVIETPFGSVTIPAPADMTVMQLRETVFELMKAKLPKCCAVSDLGFTMERESGKPMSNLTASLSDYNIGSSTHLFLSIHGINNGLNGGAKDSVTFKIVMGPLPLSSSSASSPPANSRLARRPHRHAFSTVSAVLPARCTQIRHSRLLRRD